jgi:hypothetical protein
MFDVKSLCSDSCDLTGEDINKNKMPGEMRMRRDETECVKNVLKSRIIGSVSLCKVRRIFDPQVAPPA